MAWFGNPSNKEWLEDSPTGQGVVDMFGLNPKPTLKANGVSLMAPLEALSAIAGAGEGTAVVRVVERLLGGLR